MRAAQTDGRAGPLSAAARSGSQRIGFLVVTQSAEGGAAAIGKNIFVRT